MNQHGTTDLIDFDDPSPAPASTTPPELHAGSRTGPTHPRTCSGQVPKRSQQSPPPSSIQHGPTNPSPGYGIGSAVWGLLRRISTVENRSTETSTPRLGTPQFYPHHAASIPGAGGDGIDGAFTPPRRTATPRGLPSLEPLNLRGYRNDTHPDERLLSRGIAEEIRTFLPERLKIMEDWCLAYSLYQNGSSLATLYQLSEKYRGVRAGFVLAVRDGKDGIFGAYLTETPHPAPSYYGTGECFLWRASLHAPLPPPPSADTTNVNYRTTTIASTASTSTAAPHVASPVLSDSTTPHLAPGTVGNASNRLTSPASASVQAQSVRFQAFAYTGANDYCMFCETKFLSVGGGQGGKFGLWLNDSLSRGHSAECDTFLNEPLSDEGEKFDVLGVELWVVGAS
ncbi:TLD-domain-containing protein [Poronia punctata]|nr:TLD-domain-containing protein [Poronia punctata]